MTKKIVKQLSILLSLLMTLSLLSPLAVMAEDFPDDLPLFIVADVERFTIGQDLLVEPTQLLLPKEATAYDVFANLVGPDNIIGDAPSVIGIKGADQGPESLVIPDYIVNDLEGPDTEAALNHGNPLGQALGTDSYSDQGYWLCLVNNKTLEGNWGNYEVKQGDTLRFAFTYWGMGADVSGYEQGAAEASLDMGNKDELLRLMALVYDEINRDLLNDPIVNGAYMKAMDVLGGLSNQGEIDQAQIDLEKAIDEFEIKVEYMTHIENTGWESDWGDEFTNMSGTTGKSLRLEGIKIKVKDNSRYDVGIQYKTHIENRGWEEAWTKDGGRAGTEGQALRLEAIKIELTGEDAGLFDVYYQVHAQDVGWMDLAQNGDPAGTQGFGRRLEAIHIQVVPKDQEPFAAFVVDVPVAFEENK